MTSIGLFPGNPGVTCLTLDWLSETGREMALKLAVPKAFDPFHPAASHITGKVRAKKCIPGLDKENTNLLDSDLTFT